MNEAQEIMGAVTLPLSTPIQAHKNTLTKLTLRRPTPKECRDIGGLPYSLGGGNRPQPLLNVAAEYIVLCAGIPLSSVDQLDLADFNKAVWSVIGFFMTSVAEASAS